MEADRPPLLTRQPTRNHSTHINLSSTVFPSYGATIPPPAEAPFSVASLLEHAYVFPPQLASIQRRPLRHFYERQNALLDAIVTTVPYNPHPPSSYSSLVHSDVQVRRAMIASNICNALLLFAQFYAFLASASLSMLAVFTESLLDTISALVVMLTWVLRHRSDHLRYPVGRARLEPLGVITMACLMTATTLVTLERAIGALFLESTHVVVLSPRTVLILLTALFVKAALYLYCNNIDDISVHALAEDHFNDCLSNSVSLLTVFIAQNPLLSWLDPLGAVLISILIIRNWVSLAVEHCDQLVGKTASPHFYNLITFIVCTHNPHIQLVDTVRVYHNGVGLYAEVDIVLDADMRLSEAHDIGESLQKKIERIEDVERCFVHLDFEAVHSPNSEHKQNF